MNKQHIFVNFKRFDVPVSMGGVNRTDSIEHWAEDIIGKVIAELESYSPDEVRFAMYFPESQIISAVKAKGKSRALEIGSQGVYRYDVKDGGNFGAFTTLRPASIVSAMGCSTTIIGHCEERNEKRDLLTAAGCSDFTVISHVLNEEILRAQERNLSVLYCIGEREEETDIWDSVIRKQLRDGLRGADLSRIVIGYEPVWSIGPGKTPAGKEYITKVARLVKDTVGDVPVVYGGGLKEDNAAMLAGIDEIDGGLIALTRFRGEIGFYPEEYLNIVSTYMNEKRGELNET